MSIEKNNEPAIVIIKYNAGNIRSVQIALERIGAQAIITDDAEKILSADKIIFPGVGEAGTAMNYLKHHGIDEVIKSVTKPLLGICLGLQLLCRYSEESNTKCLGIFDADIKKFNSKNFKTTHVGWNTIRVGKNPLLKNIRNNSFCYFVHSYYAEVTNNTIATTMYANKFSSALNKNNFYGVQFHPEKSAATGEEILRNFVHL
jgi:glutamine amidotransferase